MRLLTASALIVSLATVAQAQRAEPAGVLPGTQSGIPQAGTSAPAYALPARVVLASGGSVAGAVGGAFMGLWYLPRKDCGGCDFAGIEAAALGAAIGSVLVSGVIAGIPEMGSSCSMKQRIGTGVVGSLAGAAAGFAAGTMFGPDGMALGYVGGSGVGSALGAAYCRK